LNRRRILISILGVAVLFAVFAAGAFAFFVAPEFRAREAKEKIIACIETGDYKGSIELVEALAPSDYERIRMDLGTVFSSETDAYLQRITPDNCMESENFEKAEAINILMGKLGIQGASKAQSSLELYLKLKEFVEFEPFVQAVLSQETEEWLNAFDSAAAALESYVLTGASESLLRNNIEKIEAVSYERFGMDNYGIMELEEHRKTVAAILRQIVAACAANQKDRAFTLLTELSHEMDTGLSLMEEAKELINEKSQIFDEFQNSLN
jgi:hypothetical protein